MIKAFAGEPPVVRAVNLPLVLSVVGAPALERGALVRVKLGQVDTMALDVKATFISLLDTVSAPEEDNAEDDNAVGPIAIAMDMEDAASDASTPGETAPNTSM